jgi:hypothetical protein
MSKVASHTRRTRNGTVRVKSHRRKGGQRQPGLFARIFRRRPKPTAAEVRAFKAGRSTDKRAAAAYAAGETGQSEFKKRKAQAAAARRNRRS